MQYPKITIITVCYNAAKIIDATINSVFKQTYPVLDYVIIDGGSTDGTLEVIKKCQNKLKYWISEPDKGIYDAMNKGWAAADHDSYILFLGAGDKILSLPKLESFADADVIYGNVEIGEEYVFKSKHNFMLKLGNTIHHQAELVNKQIHLAPPFSLQYKTYADFDFNQQLLLKGARFKKDNSFNSYALEGGVSYIFNKKEPLEIVRANYGFIYYLVARLYYSYKESKR